MEETRQQWLRIGRSTIILSAAIIALIIQLVWMLVDYNGNPHRHHLCSACFRSAVIVIRNHPIHFSDLCIPD